MGDAITEHTVLSRDHARMDSTLDCYFTFAQGDVGLRSNHPATVAILINRQNCTVANADAAEEAMFQAVEAVTRHRACRRSFRPAATPQGRYGKGEP
jgi:hypothetical protein